MPKDPKQHIGFLHVGVAWGQPWDFLCPALDVLLDSPGVSYCALVDWPCLPASGFRSIAGKPAALSRGIVISLPAEVRMPRDSEDVNVR